MEMFTFQDLGKSILRLFTVTFYDSEPFPSCPHILNKRQLHIVGCERSLYQWNMQTWFLLWELF